MIKQPYAILSDQHCHDWSRFSEVGKNGVNSRLQIILDEMTRAAEVLKGLGGKDMLFAGDLFHVRGKIQPSVFNPTYDCIRAICEGGMNIYAIPGNHDLEGKNADALGNAMQQLSLIENFHVITKSERFGDVIMIPWMDKPGQVLDTMIDMAADDYCETGERDHLHVIIHTPVNGVIMNIPDHGLNASDIDDYGFGAVFAGHYHDHKKVADSVWSIGATTHQTWNDPNTKAGFIIVGGKEPNRTPVEVGFYYSEAPSFINFDEIEEDADVLLKCVPGNYIRIRGSELTEQEAKELRDDLITAGAAGVVDHSSRKMAVTRIGSSVKSGESIEASISTFIDKHTEAGVDKKDLFNLCQSILNDTTETE